MADVFISYSKLERELTVKLATALERAGLSVWWDTELLPAQRFRAEIDAQLDACSATVIIWSAQSSGSDWVRSEADHARRQGKLVNAHHTDIVPEDLPKPFGQIHSVPLADTDRIIKAVNLLKGGKLPAPTDSSSLEASATRFITEAISDALKYAVGLRHIADREDWEDDRSYAETLLRIAEQVETPLRLFRDRLPYDEVTSYRGRRLIELLDSATEHPIHQIAKEIRWLREYGDRKGVVIGARGDLSNAAAQLVEEVELQRE